MERRSDRTCYRSMRCLFLSASINLNVIRICTNNIIAHISVLISVHEPFSFAVIGLHQPSHPNHLPHHMYACVHMRSHQRYAYNCRNNFTAHYSLIPFAYQQQIRRQLETTTGKAIDRTHSNHQQLPIPHWGTFASPSRCHYSE